MAELPLVRRFPALATIPRVSFGTYPTAVQRIDLPGGRALWVKREDLSSPRIGGNKVRSLEWLLGDVRPGDFVGTVGPRGSTHALATVRFTRARGAWPFVVRWDQEMNPAARAVAERLAMEARMFDMWIVPAAYALALWIRMMIRPHWVPAGGTTPRGILGHVNAGLELAEQVERGECPPPAEVVVPLGTGGTAAGIALGLRLAALRARVRAVRVAPRVIASAWRARRLANRTAALIERLTGERLPRVSRSDIVVDSGFYAGGYGRSIPAPATERLLEPLAIRLDDTYSRKAFAAALGASDPTLFWLTFDGKLLQD